VTEEFELDTLAAMPNYYSWIMQTFAPFVHGKVVEYGAGIGTISQHLVPLAQRLTLVEPSPNLAHVLRGKFGNDPKVEVIQQSLEQHAGTMDADAITTVVMVNVLEHIEDDRQALAALFHMLEPDGRLLIFVPALQALMSKFDRMVGHFRRYHRIDLITKIEDAGGRAQICRYFDFAGVMPWLLLNKVMGATRFNPKFVGINDKFVVPMSQALEQLVPPPIGKNIILVALKK
jgi:SAM-dependent methyltransferase